MHSAMICTAVAAAAAAAAFGYLLHLGEALRVLLAVRFLFLFLYFFCLSFFVFSGVSVAAVCVRSDDESLRDRANELTVESGHGVLQGRGQSILIGGSSGGALKRAVDGWKPYSKQAQGWFLKNRPHEA